MKMLQGIKSQATFSCSGRSTSWDHTWRPRPPIPALAAPPIDASRRPTSPSGAVYRPRRCKINSPGKARFMVKSACMGARQPRSPDDGDEITTSSKAQMWVEKYRPKDIKDVAAQQEVRIFVNIYYVFYYIFERSHYVHGVGNKGSPGSDRARSTSAPAILRSARYR